MNLDMYRSQLAQCIVQHIEQRLLGHRRSAGGRDDCRRLALCELCDRVDGRRQGVRARRLPRGKQTVEGADSPQQPLHPWVVHRVTLRLLPQLSPQHGPDLGRDLPVARRAPFFERQQARRERRARRRRRRPADLAPRGRRKLELGPSLTALLDRLPELLDRCFGPLSRRAGLQLPGRRQLCQPLPRDPQRAVPHGPNHHAGLFLVQLGA